jgi:acetyl esterase
MPTLEPPFTLRERAQARAGRLLAGLPPRAQVRLSGRPPVRNADGDVLEPGIQLLLAARERIGAERLAAGQTPAERRASSRREALMYLSSPTPVGSVRDLQVEGAAGPLPARHYAPDERGGPHPALLYLHGGGWVIGDLDTHDETCRLLCHHGGTHVVAVDYRMAPEHPFPAPVEDAWAALSWLHANAQALGADPARIAVGGDSAGGNLSAVASLQARDAGGPAPVLQVLIYPAVDLSSRDTPSSREFGSGFFLTDEDRDFYELHYLGEHRDKRDPRLSPLLRDDLAGVAPAIVLTAGFDPLRDEGEAYAAKLRGAGVRVAARRAPGLIHGFVNMTAVNRPSREETVALAGMVRAMLA